MFQTEMENKTAVWLMISFMTAAALALGGNMGVAQGASTFDTPIVRRVPVAHRPAIARGAHVSGDGLVLLMLLAQGGRPNLAR